MVVERFEALVAQAGEVRNTSEGGGCDAIFTGGVYPAVVGEGRRGRDFVYVCGGVEDYCSWDRESSQGAVEIAEGAFTVIPASRLVN